MKELYEVVKSKLFYILIFLVICLILYIYSYVINCLFLGINSDINTVLFETDGNLPGGDNNTQVTQENGANLGSNGENPNPNSVPDGSLLGHNTHQNDESDFSFNPDDLVAAADQINQDNMAAAQQINQDNMAAAQQINQNNIPEAQDRTPTWILDARASIRYAYSERARHEQAVKKETNRKWRERWCRK